MYLFQRLVWIVCIIPKIRRETLGLKDVVLTQSVELLTQGENAPSLLNWERRPQDKRARGRRKKEKQVEQGATENMAERKAVIKNADMSEDMQQDSIDCATQVFHRYS